MLIKFPISFCFSCKKNPSSNVSSDNQGYIKSISEARIKKQTNKKKNTWKMCIVCTHIHIHMHTYGFFRILRRTIKDRSILSTKKQSPRQTQKSILGSFHKHMHVPHTHADTINQTIDRHRRKETALPKEIFVQILQIFIFCTRGCFVNNF